VQRFIVLAYPESRSVQAALRQYAKSISAWFGTDPKVSHADDAIAEDRATECVFYVMRPPAPYQDGNLAIGEVRAAVLNSNARERAYQDSENMLRGSRTRPSDPRRNCDFDPERLARESLPDSVTSGPQKY